MHLTKHDIECLQEAKKIIEKNIARHYTIPEIAREIGFSCSKLKTKFKYLFGMSVYKYREDKRLEKGKLLLENTEQTLKHISRTLGYKYKNNFSTAFKKKFGKTPTDCRN